MMNGEALKDALVTNIATVLMRHAGVTQDELAANPEKYLWVIDEAWKIACASIKAVREVSA